MFMGYTTLMVGLGQILVIFCCLQVNKNFYKNSYTCTTCHGFQSSCQVSPLYVFCLAFEMHLSKLNNNNNDNDNNKKNFEN